MSAQVLKKKSLGNTKRPRKLFLCSLRALSMPGRQYQALPSAFLGDIDASTRYSSNRGTKMPHSVQELSLQNCSNPNIPVSQRIHLPPVEPNSLPAAPACPRQPVIRNRSSSHCSSRALRFNGPGLPAYLPAHPPPVLSSHPYL